jgi:hypothetical protein
VKLWVDDLRPPPDETWTWAVDSFDALQNLAFSASDGEEGVAEISLDHDLGGADTTRPVVLWMAEHNRWPSIVRVHSMNVVGVEWLEGMINRYGPGVTR